MVLRVPPEDFARAAREACGAERGYVCAEGTGTILSAGGRGCIVMATTPRTVREAKAELEASGLPASDGRWSLDGAGELAAAPYVAAVAYATGTEKPGLWIDASPASRAAGAIVQAMYDEFQSGGEVDSMTFEEFVEVAHPTVIELSPEELAKYLEQHGGPAACK